MNVTHPSATPAALFAAAKRAYDLAVREAMVDPSPANRAIVDEALRRLNEARAEVVAEGHEIIAATDRR